MKIQVLAVLLAVIFSVSCESEVGRCVDRLQDLGAIKVDLPRSVNYTGAQRACCNQNLMLLVSFGKLQAEEMALCDGSLVPYGVQAFETCLSMEVNSTAVNLTSGQRQNVSSDFLFSCVLCQQKPVHLPLSQDLVYDDLTPGENFVVQLTRIDADVGANFSKIDLILELCSLLALPYCAIHYQRDWTDDDQRLHIEFHVYTAISPSIAVGHVETSVMNDTFAMRVEDVGFCPEEDTVNVDGVVIHWPKTYLMAEGNDSFHFATNTTTGAIIRRNCHFNADIFHGEWLPGLTRWELVWKDCLPEEQFFNEVDYIQFLNSTDIERRHSEVLDDFTTVPVTTSIFQVVARKIEQEVNARNELSERIMRAFVTITANLTLHFDPVVAVEPRVSLLVADLEDSEPVKGFALEVNPDSVGERDNVTLFRKPPEQASFAFDISARLLEAHTRVVFMAIWKNTLLIPYMRNKSPLCQYVEVTVIFPIQYEVSAWSFASYGNHHVDITYDKSVMLYKPREYGDRLFNFLTCIAWNDDIGDWTSRGCTMLYENRGNFSACRCSGKYFVMRDGVPMARFSLKKGMANDKLTMHNDPFTDFFKDKPGLIAATLIECLLSVLGLGSIIATAILFKKWRENTGHKILLHMVLALTCNLVLGFVASFMRMTTDGVGCLIYGVLRHYSFFAMFLWMLVLSCLQLKRLTTVAGAKGTSHLILKVSLFAWGLPLVPIIFLLSYNYGFYQSDRFDRGYCYPEGIVFQVTVQGPAGIILLVNSGIFIRIVTKIFGCCVRNEITRHSKNERAEQLNKLKTSLFIFFLFGFSWVFHIFSEERVIVSDFLFEYLFLMTATIHIFVLSLFFIILQDGTRKEWIALIRKATRNHNENLEMRAMQ